MKRKPSEPTFKPYTMAQPSLIPPSWDELIPAEHIVRVVNRAIDKIDLEPLLRKYKGGGTSSYHPQMMLKVLVYAYSQRMYSSRQIAKALRENVNFMWLSGGNRPDFRTINGFRGEKMKGAIEEVFTSVLELLVEEGYVKLENYFVDGTKVEANANRHKVVWAKSRAKYEQRLREKVKELLKEIDAVNEAENEEYGDKDLEEMGGGGGLTSEKLEKKIAELNQRLKEQPEDKKLAKAVKVMKKDYLPRQRRYEEQERKLAGRSSYAKTDPDATFFRMKEDRGAEKPLPKPAYNVQMGTEGQFVVGFSIHQRAGDTSCLIPHLERVNANLSEIARRNPEILPVHTAEEHCGASVDQPRTFPLNISADAGYGSEENYAYLADHRMGSYVKYNIFHRQQQKHRKPELIRKALFRSENFPYDPDQDVFICPANQPMTYQGTRRERTDNGYWTELRHYQASGCNTCPLKPECTRAKGNRQIRVSFRLRRFREQACSNLLSEQGRALRIQRNVEVESVFGHIKHNRHFRRFSLRGLEKVNTEWGLLCIAHNMQKLAG
jgi:transposase